MENENLEVNELGEDDLIALYDMVSNHIQYLKESVIVISEEEGESTDE